MDWYQFYDFLNYAIIAVFLLFIPWVVLISRRQHRISQSVISISNDSIDLARQAVELSTAQLKEMQKTNHLLQELINEMKK